MTEATAELSDALTGMERCIAALAIELPESVWADVVKRWRRFRDAVNCDDRDQRCPEVWQDESQVCRCWKSLGHDGPHSFDE